jgi:hypothetical protein
MRPQSRRRPPAATPTVLGLRYASNDPRTRALDTQGPSQPTTLTRCRSLGGYELAPCGGPPVRRMLWAQIYGIEGAILAGAGERGRGEFGHESEECRRSASNLRRIRAR